jgi:hypothetical protein
MDTEFFTLSLQSRSSLSQGGGGGFIDITSMHYRQVEKLHVDI